MSKTYRSSINHLSRSVKAEAELVGRAINYGLISDEKIKELHQLFEDHLKELGASPLDIEAMNKLVGFYVQGHDKGWLPAIPFTAWATFVRMAYAVGVSKADIQAFLDWLRNEKGRQVSREKVEESVDSTLDAVLFSSLASVGMAALNAGKSVQEVRDAFLLAAQLPKREGRRIESYLLKMKTLGPEGRAQAKERPRELTYEERKRRNKLNRAIIKALGLDASVNKEAGKLASADTRFRKAIATNGKAKWAGVEIEIGGEKVVAAVAM